MHQEVEFTARMENADVVWDDADGKPAKDHKLQVGKGAPPLTIMFKLKDQTALQLRFDQSDPIHIWEEEGCPPPGIGTDQVEILEPGSRTLKIRNLNTGSPRTLQYRLNVRDKDGNERHCDPIIINDGGGPGFI